MSNYNFTPTQPTEDPIKKLLPHRSNRDGRMTQGIPKRRDKRHLLKPGKPPLKKVLSNAYSILKKLIGEYNDFKSNLDTLYTRENQIHISGMTATRKLTSKKAMIHKGHKIRVIHKMTPPPPIIV